MQEAKSIRGQRGEKLQASRPDTVGDFADVVTDQVPERHRGAFASPFAWRSSRPPLRDCFGKNRRSTNLAKADDLWSCQELRPISHEGASLAGRTFADFFVDFVMLAHQRYGRPW